MALTAGTPPTAPDGTRTAMGYAPGVGPIPMQLDTATADTAAGAGGQQSAPLMTRTILRDATNTNFGTVANPLATNQLVGTPVYGTAVLAIATGGNASLAAAAGKTTYINGFCVIIGHATTASTPNGQVTLSLDGGSTTHMNFLIAISQSYPGLIEINFPDPIPATAVNTTIKVTAPTLANGGAGSISVFGYQL